MASRSRNALTLLSGRLITQPTDPLPTPVAVVPVPVVDVPKAYDHSAATAALTALISPHGLTLEEMEIYSASQGLGQVFEDMSKAEMTEFYKLVRSSLKEDADGFVGMVQEIAGTDLKDAA